MKKPGGRPGKVLRIPVADLWRVAAGAIVLTVVASTSASPEPRRPPRMK
ncbi:MAG: hypothetical protein AABY08_05215 [Candidatus Thermoplasmatota archaeon]